ncbi:MAG: ATP-binding cassette domain-containing protein [Spirochaetes bacterium]|nr:ATP-binding cassette domain-containing protein [Spirochaetota bacterium]MBN2769493.1 ATP-binding cassette domain-containing protein [Spirochaetota bacterium]
MIRGAARGNENPGKESLSINELIKENPDIAAIIEELGIPRKGYEAQSLSFLCEEAGVDPDDIFTRLENKNKTTGRTEQEINYLTIEPGTNKTGKKEFKENIEICKGEVIALVGPTGAGKSLMLSDIEGMAAGDSPSSRIIKINGKNYDEFYQGQNIKNPIALISQSMNYLIDLKVNEFLDIHMECCEIADKHLQKKVVDEACHLCGESFSLDTRMVSLSGGQARALMISDSLNIARAPVILVDEIENAGIRKDKAVELLVDSSSISIIATHDPFIALLANRRIILQNGGISSVIERSESEKETVKILKKINEYSENLKDKLRSGKILDINFKL